MTSFLKYEEAQSNINYFLCTRKEGEISFLLISHGFFNFVVLGCLMGRRVLGFFYFYFLFTIDGSKDRLGPKLSFVK